MKHLCPAWQFEEKEICRKCIKKEECKNQAKGDL